VFGKHHVDLFLVIVSALYTCSIYGVVTPAVHDHPISLVILDWTGVEPRDDMSNSIMNAFYVDDFGTILLKE
jgi:hypothetical protein